MIESIKLIGMIDGKFTVALKYEGENQYVNMIVDENIQRGRDRTLYSIMRKISYDLRPSWEDTFPRFFLTLVILGFEV